ncbi:acyltransferase family protein [Mucilaginibacter sp. E4BP6]|uniref:acyltransferase family protein n=1 Tax=Mucilaginibacter sp. E4BP6 TaxID=2723089 RepID=UPI0015C9F0BA|nr:acyltransferase family protein [Mucilaginibacter sp. E4BP6]
MSTLDNKRWIKGLDSIRFVLAFIVLLSHYSTVLVYTLKISPSNILRFCGLILANTLDGTAAVMAFFILSGFVIHHHYKNGIVSIKQYAIRRFLRIFIPLIVIYVAGIKFNHPDKTVIWSLICELIYYALYPLLAITKTSWLKKTFFIFIISFIIILAGAHRDVLAFFTQTGAYQGYYWQLGPFLTWIIGLPVWLLGVLIAENVDNLKSISFSKLSFYRFLIFTVSCLCVAGQLYWHISYILSMNIFALLMYKWIKSEIAYFKNHQPNSLTESMGKFSYSLYLCHPLIYAILSIWLVNNMSTYILFVFLAVFISYLFYLIVEKPSHRLAMKLSRI